MQNSLFRVPIFPLKNHLQGETSQNSVHRTFRTNVDKQHGSSRCVKFAVLLEGLKPGSQGLCLFCLSGVRGWARQKSAWDASRTQGDRLRHMAHHAPIGPKRISVMARECVRVATKLRLGAFWRGSMQVLHGRWETFLSHFLSLL